MNSLFLIAFFFFLAAHLALDLRKLKRIGKLERGVYLTVYALATAFYLCLAIGWLPPMPSQWFVNVVSPKVIRLMTL